MTIVSSVGCQLIQLVLLKLDLSIVPPRSAKATPTDCYVARLADDNNRLPDRGHRRTTLRPYSDSRERAVRCVSLPTATPSDNESVRRPTARASCDGKTAR